MDWFRHDLSAQQDIKIRKLIRKYGYEGYGLYWHAVELLYQNDGWMKISDLQEEFDLINETNFPEYLEDLGLIGVEGDYFTSTRIQEEINYQADCKRKKSEAGKKGNAVRWQSNRNAIAEQSQCDSKVSQIIAPTYQPTNLPTNKQTNKFVKPTVDDIRSYCESRGNGIDPDYFFNYYEVRNWIPSGARTQMKDWKRAIITWEQRDKKPLPKTKICNSAELMRSSMNSAGGFDL